MCSVCGIRGGINTANNTLKHIRDVHGPGDRAVLLEVSNCFDAEGNVPQDFSPHTNIPWTNHQYWKDLEP
eukprot:8306428-Karenia_brevis.AAC.1